LYCRLFLLDLADRVDQLYFRMHDADADNLLWFNLLYGLYVDYWFVVLLVGCVAGEHHGLGVVAALADGPQIVHWFIVLLLVVDER